MGHVFADTELSNPRQPGMQSMSERTYRRPPKPEYSPCAGESGNEKVNAMGLDYANIAPINPASVVK